MVASEKSNNISQFVINSIHLIKFRCRSSSRGDNLNSIGLGVNPLAMEVNGSHRSLQHQQQQASTQRMPNGGGVAGRDHWSKLPEPQNGHDPQVT